MIDGRAGMAAVGDLDDYLKFRRRTRSAPAAADGGGNGGGGGSAGPAAAVAAAAARRAAMEIGMGAGLGMLLPGMVLRSLSGEPITSAAC